MAICPTPAALGLSSKYGAIARQWRRSPGRRSSGICELERSRAHAAPPGQDATRPRPRRAFDAGLAEVARYVRLVASRHRSHRSRTSAMTTRAYVARRGRRRRPDRDRRRRRSSCRPMSAPTLIAQRNSKPLVMVSSFGNGTSRIAPPNAHASAKLHVEVVTACWIKSRSEPTAARNGSLPGCRFLAVA